MPTTKNFVLVSKRRKFRFSVNYCACDLSNVKAGKVLESCDCEIVSGDMLHGEMGVRIFCVEERIREVPLYRV